MPADDGNDDDDDDDDDLWDWVVSHNMYGHQ
jgi:hypothetical protein